MIAFMFFVGVISLVLLVVLEYLLRLDIDLYSVSSSINIKKIPKLILDRRYHFLDSNQDRINWLHDPYFGWKLKKNSRLDIIISIPGLNLTHKFYYETDNEGRRKTRKVNSIKNLNKKTISIYGCSFTFGHSLSDYQTYPWLLQKKFEEKIVHNYAVAGYSLYQSMLVLEKTIIMDSPEIVVVGFHPDLGWRNTCSFEWAERLQNTWRIPSCVSDSLKLKRYKPKGFISFRRNIRIIKIVERLINKFRFNNRDKPEVIRQTMEHLLFKMRYICEKNKTKFVVACIDDSAEYYDFLEKNQFNWCISGVNTKEVDANGIYKWILFPFDNHPNEAANHKYAESIELAIKKILKGSRAKPKEGEYIIPSLQSDRGEYVYPHS
jgi:hypothetical protein